MRILSGIQPSGKLHIGNYFGALRQFVQLQDRGEAIFFIADWHALTTIRDGKLVRQNTLDVALDYLAFGLDPARSVIFRQSDVPQHVELAWILATVTPMALLERAHSFKDKVARGIPADMGLFNYPLLMAADILLYKPDGVPVGQDQKQHVEIARDACTKFNSAYVPGYNPQDPTGQAGGTPGILKLPDPIIIDQVAVVPGIDGQKMSKSYNNTIELFAPDDVVRKKIMSIKTDSTPVEAAKPADSHLLQLLSIMAPAEEVPDLKASWQQGGVGYGEYKKKLVSYFMATFEPARQRRRELENNLDYVEDVLRRGAEQARAIAADAWNQVVTAVGAGRPI